MIPISVLAAVQTVILVSLVEAGLKADGETFLLAYSLIILACSFLAHAAEKGVDILGLADFLEKPGAKFVFIVLVILLIAGTVGMGYRYLDRMNP